MIKKLLASALAVIIVLSALAACGGGASSRQESQSGEAQGSAAGSEPLPQESSGAEESFGAEENKQSGGSGVELTPASSGASSEDGEPAAEQEELFAVWSRIVGYWNAAGGVFALPDMEDSHTALLLFGIWETDYYRGYGQVTELWKSGEEELAATVTWPAIEENEINGAVDEETHTVLIDYSGLDRDGRISIKVGDGEWVQYSFAGGTFEEAYQTYCQNTYGS